MNPYIENLKHFLANQTPNFGYKDADSLLKMLHYYYTAENPIDSVALRCRFRDVETLLSRFTLEEHSRIFQIIADLCVEHEREAFLAGVQVGARLFTELSEIS